MSNPPRNSEGESENASQKRNPRVTPSQKRALVDYMVQNQNFANRKFVGPLGNRQNKRMWCEVARVVNELGPSKTVEQWKIVWKDLKLQTRRKNAAVDKTRSQTGDSTEVNLLNDDEMRILSIIGQASSVGLNLPESGLSSGLDMQVKDDVVHPMEASLLVPIKEEPVDPLASTPLSPTLPPIVIEVPQRKNVETSVQARASKSDHAYAAVVQETNESLKDISKSLMVIADSFKIGMTTLAEAVRGHTEAVRENTEAINKQSEKQNRVLESFSKVATTWIRLHYPDIPPPPEFDDDVSTDRDETR